MKKAILLVAYGANTPEARKGLAHIEALCRRRFAGLPIRWAFTSEILRERLVRQKKKSDSLNKAIWRLHMERFAAVAAQPLQTIAGYEHEESRKEALECMQATGMACAIGKPLLSSENDLPKVAERLLAHVPPARLPCENVIFMGHGARHPSGILYGRLDETIRRLDCNIRVGAMSGENRLGNILPELAPGPVWLLPLFAAIGKHALKDMAGDVPESWRSRIETAGHECRPMLNGLAECPAICQLWLDNLQAALEELAE